VTSNVLIRDVAADDLDQIRAAATACGTSVQGYLRAAVHAQAVWLRRQQEIRHASARLRGRPAVPEDEREAVLAALNSADDERADQLGRRSAR